MKTAIINVRVEPKVKRAAQRRAKELGIPLSVFLAQKLQDFALGRAESLHFPAEPMTPQLERLIEEIEQENATEGTVGPFTSIQEGIDYLKSV